MGEMASTLAHEINQPLSAISNYLQGCNRLLEPVEHPNVPKIRDALAETTKQTLRAGHIIRQLREFVARGETEKRPENISKLVEEASALALVGAKEEGVKTLFRFDQPHRYGPGREGADPAGAAQSHAQRHRGHAGLRAQANCW